MNISESKKLVGFFSLEQHIKDLESMRTKFSIKVDKNPTESLGQMAINNLKKTMNSLNIYAIYFAGLLNVKGQEELIESILEIKETATKSNRLMATLDSEVSEVIEFFSLLNKILDGDSRMDIPGVLNGFNYFKDATEILVDEYFTNKSNKISKTEAEAITGLFKVDRKISYFEAYPEGEMEIFKAFKEKFETTTLITGEIEECIEADEHGADFIAKKGFKLKNGLESHMFDVTVASFLDLPIVRKDYEYSSLDTKIKDYFKKKTRFVTAKLGSGVFVYLIPSFALPHFSTAINNKKIEVNEIYKLNEKVVVVVGFNKDCDLIAQNRKFRAATLYPNRILGLDEAEDLIEFDDEYKFPVNFRPMLLEEQDHIKNIEMMNFDLESEIVNTYTVVENISRMSRPVQEYRLGHLSAVAINGIADGIQDETVHPDYFPDDLLCPHIYTAKMHKLEEEHSDLVVSNGEEYEELIYKQRAVISIAMRYQDGTNQILLDTSNNVSTLEIENN